MVWLWGGLFPYLYASMPEIAVAGACACVSASIHMEWTNKQDLLAPGSVKHRLSDTFQLTIVTQREHVLLTSGFHHSMAHSFGYLETKIQVCDVTRTPMRSQNVCGVDHQLSG